MLADYHLHTNNSGDSLVPMESYVKRALELGFSELCFTDHSDIDVPNVKCTNPVRYWSEFQEIQRKYFDKIKIRLGMEFGAQTFTIPKFEALFKAYPFDFILLSFHTVDNLMLWNYEYQKGKTQDEYNNGYYTEILNVIKQFKNYSVLGHLDVIRRYDTSYCFTEEVQGLVAQILDEVIKDGKGLEINTSSVRYNLPDTMPSSAILKMYKDMGGEILTFGSDAHRVEDFGADILNMRKIASNIGFKHFYTFDKMQPVQHDILEKVVV